MDTQTITRKLAAILSADVHGYSRLMGEDEVATIHTLTAHREIMTSHGSRASLSSPATRLSPTRGKP